jgi:tRNA (guanine10-N2)-dimethyltransferase
MSYPYFCYLSGEHSLLPKAEVFAILESESQYVTLNEFLPQVLRINTTLTGAKSIAERAAYTHNCCLEILKSETEIFKILEASKACRFDEYVFRGETFRVLIEGIRYVGAQEYKDLESKIGELILESAPGVKVNLTEPDKTFFGLIHPQAFLLGLLIYVHKERPHSRRLSLRPFFHPSAMPPKLARCMVNLARIKPGDTVLDAFCGTGSILIEAGLMKCKVVGIDIDPRMVKGTRKNLKFCGISGDDIMVGDARKLPLRTFDCVVSDPPYGRGSSSHGLNVEILVEDFLREAFNILPAGRHICLAFPQYNCLAKISERLGYMTVEKYLKKEHKSLKREIIVLRKP